MNYKIYYTFSLTNNNRDKTETLRKIGWKPNILSTVQPKNLIYVKQERKGRLQ